MKLEQQEALRELLYAISSSESEFRHGDCIGADSEAAAIAWSLGFRLIAHPSISSRMRAWTTFNHLVLDPKPSLERDKDIVLASKVLIAAPHTSYEIQRSGTWTTVRYAREAKRPIYKVFPDGTVKTENIQI